VNAKSSKTLVMQDFSYDPFPDGDGRPSAVSTVCARPCTGLDYIDKVVINLRFVALLLHHWQ